MNRLKETRRILDSLGFAERHVRTGENVERLDDVLPSPETDRSVRLARHLNGVLREVGGDELSPELEHKIYNLRNKIEKEAIEVITDRIEIEESNGPNGFDRTEMIDPVSKISYQVTEAYKDHSEAWRETYNHEIARSVVEP